MNIQDILDNYWKDLIQIQVDVDIFKNNINIVRNHIGKDTKIILAAKSAAYSLGKEMADYSKDVIDGIAVESLHSGLEHSCSGFEKDIYVFSPFLPQSMTLLPYLNEYRNVIPCLESLELAEKIVKTCQEKQYRVRVAIKINSGLNRFGLLPSQLTEIMNILDRSPVTVDSVYTHFSGTTDSAIESLKEKESQFLKLTEPYRKNGIKVHIADSACTVRGIGTDLSLVRIGLLPIGIDPVEVEHTPIPGLKLCFKVLSTVLHITDVKKGQELGYRYFAPSDKKAATILGGYAHGLPRDASFDGYAMIKGVKCPYAAKSFMEYSIIDISACDFPVSVGDQVEIFSNECHPFNLADSARNIPEIFFTSLSKSLQRTYVKLET